MEKALKNYLSSVAFVYVNVLYYLCVVKEEFAEPGPQFSIQPEVFGDLLHQ